MEKEMNEELQARITSFFQYWRTRHSFICELDVSQNNYEANVLIWANLDALSGIWSEYIGQDQIKNKGKSKRLIYDSFLAHYGGELFQIISLPDVWKRVDLGNNGKNQNAKLVLSGDIFKSLGKVGNRQDPDEINRCQNRTCLDDWSLETTIGVILEDYPETDRNDLEEWLKLSRYGSIAYKEMRCAYIHEGRPGSNTHSFNLSSATIQPTYQSGLYNVHSTIGFSAQFMLKTLGRCIDEFEAEALKLMKDPCPPLLN